MYFFTGIFIGYHIRLLIDFINKKIEEKREREEWKEFDSFFE